MRVLKDNKGIKDLETIQDILQPKLQINKEQILIVNEKRDDVLYKK